MGDQFVLHGCHCFTDECWDTYAGANRIPRKQSIKTGSFLIPILPSVPFLRIVSEKSPKHHLKRKTNRNEANFVIMYHVGFFAP